MDGTDELSGNVLSNRSYRLQSTAYANGVAERFNRTLKEQAIHGRIFRTLEDVRAAVATFVEDYNAHWRPEKLEYRTPVEARQEYVLRQVA